jgi:outer membrane murein-binding lipoprotein Lpp
VRRTAVGTAFVLLVGVTIGFAQRINTQADTIDAKTAQVKHLRSDLTSTKSDLFTAKSNLAEAQREVTSEQGKVTDLTTCVNDMRTALGAISLDLESFGLGTPNTDALAVSPAEVGNECEAALSAAS